MQLILFGYHVQITKFRAPNRDRIYKLITRRRKSGACRQCGIKINEISKYTNMLYAKCENCRQKESINQHNRLIKAKLLLTEKEYEKKMKELNS